MIRRRRSRGPTIRQEKCKDYCRKLVAFLFSHIGLCALVVGYSVVGALTFRALEAPYEQITRKSVKQLREKMIDDLWDTTLQLNVLYQDNWTAIASARLKVFQKELIEKVKEGYDGKEEEGRNQWSFSGAFLYSLTVITTI
ncbi:PREDICTED: TWiK family of potassium channels protein 7-like, partial [Priapulus caudatus]|uniref:TWiK family of potassium channels protein 7-like n=1 Tax=Priapulus caudatus TaxID=37621 RepID=A0ABM1F4P1_PRICU